MPKTVRGYAATSERSRGWLRYLYRKATTPDNWDKDGEAHPHWDSYTREPTASWVRMEATCTGYFTIGGSTPRHGTMPAGARLSCPRTPGCRMWRAVTRRSGYRTSGATFGF